LNGASPFFRTQLAAVSVSVSLHSAKFQLSSPTLQGDQLDDCQTFDFPDAKVGAVNVVIVGDTPYGWNLRKFHSLFLFLNNILEMMRFLMDDFTYIECTSDEVPLTSPKIHTLECIQG